MISWKEGYYVQDTKKNSGGCSLGCIGIYIQFHLPHYKIPQLPSCKWTINYFKVNKNDKIHVIHRSWNNYYCFYLQEKSAGISILACAKEKVIFEIPCPYWSTLLSYEWPVHLNLHLLFPCLLRKGGHAFSRRRQFFTIFNSALHHL